MRFGMVVGRRWVRCVFVGARWTDYIPDGVGYDQKKETIWVGARKRRVR